jgi:shikimate kinase
MLIALVGNRGTGKTTVGRLLAQRLGWDWVDADDEVERRAQMSVADIFARHGEAAFRDWESDVLQGLVRRDRTVVALGGGVVLRAENRQALAGATVVWLAASPETLYRRIASDPATAARRPNLTEEGGLSEMVKLVDQRKDFYRQCATLLVDTEGKTPDEVAAEILARLPLLIDPPA